MSNFAGGGKRYYVVFENSVAGLTTGSSVGFQGLKVGEVQSFSLDPNDARKVHVLISVSDTTPVRQNSRASMQSMGLTGGSGIQITPARPIPRSWWRPTPTQFPPSRPIRAAGRGCSTRSPR